MYHNHAQNGSWRAIGSTHNNVVNVVRTIGCNLDLQASTIASKVSTP